jgi:hypothetical protein
MSCNEATSCVHVVLTCVSAVMWCCGAGAMGSQVRFIDRHFPGDWHPLVQGVGTVQSALTVEFYFKIL